MTGDLAVSPLSPLSPSTPSTPRATAMAAPRSAAGGVAGGSGLDAPSPSPRGPARRGVRVPVGASHLLLRGSVVRNTDWTIGLVVYTGVETKVMLNSGATPSKRSRVEMLMNPQIVLNFVVLLILCLLNGIVAGVLTFQWTRDDAPWVDADADRPFAAGFYTFWASIIMYQNIVPISLYITIEAVKTIQAYFVYADQAMMTRITLDDDGSAAARTAAASSTDIPQPA
ncbi:hypothetical protein CAUPRSCDRAFT_13014, partial [Caulochytrium protostelioides]